MNINIEGKPLKEWVEEQKKKDGVMIVHHGTVRSKFGKSTYQESIVSVSDGKDLCYEDADISLRINGKEYRLTGNRIERKGGTWYVDGYIYELPNQDPNADMADEIKDVERKLSDALNKSTGVILDNHGTTNIKSRIINHDSNIGSVDFVEKVVEQVEKIGDFNYTREKKKSTGYNIKNDFTGGETIIHGSGTRTISTGRRTVIKGGSVNIRRGDKTYTIKGETIEKIDGRWYADGKVVDWESIGGEYEERSVVNIEINGTVQNMVTTSGDVKVNGSVQNLSTGSGDVECDTAVNVSTGSGDVRCKNITGMVSTGSGDIYHR